MWKIGFKFGAVCRRKYGKAVGIAARKDRARGNGRGNAARAGNGGERQKSESHSDVATEDGEKREEGKTSRSRVRQGLQNAQGRLNWEQNGRLRTPVVFEKDTKERKIISEAGTRLLHPCSLASLRILLAR